MRRKTLLAFALLALIVCSVMVCGVDAEKNKKKKHKKRKAKATPTPTPQAVSISSDQYCKACLATVETFHKEVEREAWEKSRRRDRSSIDGVSIARNLCQGPKFSSMKPWVQYGCIKLLSEADSLVLEPLEGNHLHGETSSILQHKRQACVAAKACTSEHPLIRESFTERSPCAACRALVADMETAVELLEKPSAEDIAAAVQSVCEDIGLRHDTHSYLEEQCLELLDDAMGDGLSDADGVIVRLMKLRLRVESSGMKPSDNLSDRICVELTSRCPQPEEEDVKSEL